MKRSGGFVLCLIQVQALLLQVEVALCVVEADALDDLLQSLLVVGILAVPRALAAFSIEEI